MVGSWQGRSEDEVGGGVVCYPTAPAIYTEWYSRGGPRGCYRYRGPQFRKEWAHGEYDVMGEESTM